MAPPSHAAGPRPTELNCRTKFVNVIRNWIFPPSLPRSSPIIITVLHTLHTPLPVTFASDKCLIPVVTRRDSPYRYGLPALFRRLPLEMPTQMSDFFDPLPLVRTILQNSCNLLYYVRFSITPSPLRCGHHIWRPLIATVSDLGRLDVVMRYPDAVAHGDLFKPGQTRVHGLPACLTYCYDFFTPSRLYPPIARAVAPTALPDQISL